MTHFNEAYLKEGGSTDKMTVVYRLALSETKDEFFEKYGQFIGRLSLKKELPEFEKIIALRKKKEEIQEFFLREDIKFDEYMKPLFLYIQAEL